MGDAKLNLLIRERGFVKSSLTRQMKFFNENISSNPLDDKLVRELEGRLSRVESLLDEFNVKQNEIELFDLEEDKITEQLEERDKFESLYFDLVGKLRSCISMYFGSLETKINASSSSDSSEQPEIRQLTRSKGVELPALKLPAFSGRFENWVEFRDGFKALVHENATLSDVQKFYYLRSCLGKDALSLVESIPVTEGNYKIAWELLHDRFEQKALLIHNHVRILFEYPSVEKEDHVSLRTFFDTISKNLRALKVLGEEVEKWDRILIYLFTSKLDKVTRREWELYEISGDLPTMTDFNKFLKHRCELLEKLEVANNKNFENEFEKKQVKSNGNKFQKYQRGAYYSMENSSGVTCYFCKDKHTIFNCKKFITLSPADRGSEIRKIKLCKNCLRPGHDVTKCMHSGCKKCGRFHNTMLHIDFFKSEANNRNFNEKENSENKNVKRESDNSDENNKAGVFHASSSESTIVEKTQVLLSTAIVHVKDKTGTLHECRALLDSGSQSNFISEQLCKKLNLAIERANFKIKGVGDSVSQLNHRASLNLISCTSDYESTIECLVLKRITDNLPSVSFNRNSLKLPNNIQLADKYFNEAREIDLLIGSSLFWEIIQGGKIQLQNSRVYLQESLLGWVIGGVMSPNSNNEDEVSFSYYSSELKAESSLDNLLTKFWEIEEVDKLNTIFSEEEMFCEENFINNFERNSEGKFIVSIPFKENLHDLGNSRDSALQRYLSQERKLNKNLYLKNEYDKFMQEYLELGHMSEITEERETDKITYYMPHHAVIREHSKTTKVRVVFDASMKTESGLSLNNVQCVGPTLQSDLFSIVLRFRKHQLVMTADISKMYRNILIKNEQCSLQRIFWRLNPSDELKCFELNTVTYGTASAPYLAVRCLFQLAIETENINPRASESIKNSFYMDDFLEGADSESELLNLQSEVTNILANAGFHLRKWLCNKKELLTKFQVNKNLDSSILNLGENESNKTLGIVWDSNTDTFQYSSPEVRNPQIITKRTILSAIAQIFDPLGLLGPLILVAKLLMQSLWQGQFGWDEKLPDKLISSWLKFIGELPIINKFRIPRVVICSNYSSIELHGFGDASQKAYGCCLYIRCKNQSGQYFANILCAKSRVAPIKKLLTLPRLELCASLLLAQLAQKAIGALKIKFDKHYFYSDSQIALSWIKSPANRWKLFVANRVNEIQQLTDVNDWYHISTDQNPADLISRGITASEITNSPIWWHGPTWLTSSNWTSYINNDNSEIADLPEQKTLVHTVVVNSFDIFTRFSTLRKLQRVFAYIMRFIDNCKTKRLHRKIGFLSSEELMNSLEKLISLAQREAFPTEYKLLSEGSKLGRKSSLLSLNPIFNNGLIRVGGRLQHSNYDFDKKFPIILPTKHILTRLIIIQEHNRLMHCGPTLLLASIRERFWPISGRNICKKIVHQCITCFKVKPNPSSYLMGNLPESRVTKYLPFINIGCDFAGPFLLKDRATRGHKLIKGYVCIFICLSTKAIHLELMSDLTTKCFLAAFKRFVGRRGKPRNICSDNGKTFISADKELQKAYVFLKNQFQSEEFTQFFADQNINWSYIPSRAPSFGGIWEAGVKSFKFHFKRVVGEAHLNFEDFNTILIQIEGILNSRPLCPLPSTPDQLNPLTPAHFLLGRSLTSIPERDLTQVKENRLKRYERLQQIVQHFWTRWSREYICELQSRNKWKQQPREQLKIGAVVLVKEDNVPVLKWPMGRIESIHPGEDGEVRVVTVRMHQKLFKRPVTKICLFPID